MTRRISRKQYLKLRSAIHAQLAREIDQETPGSRAQSVSGSPPIPEVEEGAAPARAVYSTRDLPFGPGFEPDYAPDFAPPAPDKSERRRARAQHFLSTGDLS